VIGLTVGQRRTEAIITVRSCRRKHTWVEYYKLPTLITEQWMRIKTNNPMKNRYLIKILPKLETTTGSRTSRDGTSLRCLYRGMSSIQAAIERDTLFWMAKEMERDKHREEEYQCRDEGRSCP
jgi:hypothetical protein